MFSILFNSRPKYKKFLDALFFWGDFFSTGCNWCTRMVGNLIYFVDFQAFIIFWGEITEWASDFAIVILWVMGCSWKRTSANITYAFHRSLRKRRFFWQSDISAGAGYCSIVRHGMFRPTPCRLIDACPYQWPWSRPPKSRWKTCLFDIFGGVNSKNYDRFSRFCLR